MPFISLVGKFDIVKMMAITDITAITDIEDNGYDSSILTLRALSNIYLLSVDLIGANSS